MVEIKTQWVSQNVLNKRTYGTGNKKKYIVIHQTGNTGRGANAQAHANIQSRLNPRQASWHFQVDDKEAIQSFSADYHCWHAGVGRAEGNLNSIGIEMCINSDGDYLKALKNTAELTKWLMDKYNIPLSRVTQHNDWDGKNCPAQIRAGLHGVTWNGFLNMVQKDKPAVKVQGAIKVNEPVKQKGEYTGNSIVDYLASIGMKSDFNTRKELAKEYGVSDYTGTAAQNTRLLDLMREGATAEKVARKTANITADGYMGPETVRALQDYFGLVVDGEMWGQVRNQATLAFNQKAVRYGSGGSPVVRALQKHIGAKVDGYWGVETTRALQRYLGTPVDGEIWRPSTAIKEMQRRLNNGTF